MTKLKSPFLSLGAHGTIGGSITVQERHDITFIRGKPIPGYRRTLPQLYQRWLYEDYAYLWTQQSEATRRQYAATGSRYHLTGFQYWMKYQLTKLPDIAGMWHLDEKAGTIAYDSSRNANHGTIFGASPITGTIDGALLFDGINDYIAVPNATSLNPPTALTMDFFYTPTEWPPVHYGYFLFKRNAYFFILSHTDGKLYFQIWSGGVIKTYIAAAPAFIIGTTYHLAVTYASGDLRFYIDSDLFESTNTITGTIDSSTNTLYKGQHDVDVTRRLHGHLDQILLLNRVLDQTEIKRHSERRYP